MNSSIEQLDPNFAAPQEADGLMWYDARAFGIEGQGWQGEEIESPFDRLPLRAKDAVGSSVWNLSHRTAGLCVRFETDSQHIGAQWDLRWPDLAMNHMPATGVSGADLYVREERGWRFASVGTRIKDGVGKLDPRTVTPRLREYTLTFPLYNGVTSMKIAVDPGCVMRKAPPRRCSGSIVFYGTSIVQGGCASRPGMAYPAIIGRNLDCATINLGFSGNGPMQLEIAPFLAELDPSIFVIDSLPNMDPDRVRERTEPFVKTLRNKHPETPIVLVENMIYQTTLQDAPTTRHGPKNIELGAAYDRLLQAGVPHLHYVPGDSLLGDDWDSTVDGTHFTDLGFHRFSQVLLPILKSILTQKPVAKR